MSMTDRQVQLANIEKIRPLLSTDGSIRLTLSNASAATTHSVPAGDYRVALVTSAGLCWIAWAASVTLPTSGADIAAGTMAITNGDIVTAPGALQLAAILTSGTGELALTAIAP